VSQFIEAQHAIELFAHGTDGLGYLIKDRVLDPGELSDALRRVAEGGSAIDPIVIEQLLKRRSVDVALAALTNRERDVLAAMAEGRSNQSIASTLHISDKTVEACTGRIFSKLALEPSPDDHRRVRAVLAYLEATTSHD
jgi:serine/threonine-protein kinase